MQLSIVVGSAGSGDLTDLEFELQQACKMDDILSTKIYDSRLSFEHDDPSLL
jgi:hypothetical protein